MNQRDYTLMALAAIALVGLVSDMSLGGSPNQDAYAQDDLADFDISKSVSAIMASVQTLATDSYQKGYYDGYYDALVREDDGPEYAEPEYTPYEPEVFNPPVDEPDVYNPPVIEQIPYEPTAKKCANEDGFYVRPDITIIAEVRDGMLEIAGSGIEYDPYFFDQAVISFSQINDYDGLKRIYLVKVTSDGSFAGSFKSEDVFYEGYTYDGTLISGSIDSQGEYNIEIQYDDQCGFTTLNYDHESVRPSLIVESYRIPIPSDIKNFVDAHTSHSVIVELDIDVACIDGKSSCFVPDKVTIPAGGEVIFVILDGYAHNIVQGTDRSKPYDGEFRVDNLVRGGQFSYIFDESGKYPYFSHHHLNAQGVIIVE